VRAPQIESGGRIFSSFLAVIKGKTHAFIKNESEKREGKNTKENMHSSWLTKGEKDRAFPSTV